MPHLPIPIAALVLAATAAVAHAGTPEPLPRCGGSNALVAVKRATDVARVTILRSDAQHIEVDVHEQLLGKVPATISVARRDACLTTVGRVGETVIVAVDHGRLVGSPFEDIVRVADVRARLVTEFARARNSGERAKVLSDAVLRGGDTAELAARFLASSVDDALPALTADQLEVLRKHAIKHPERWLAVVLARSRIALGDRQYDLAGLEPDALARQIASIDDFESTTDTDALADLIAKETDGVRRWAAFERCDRVRKVALDAGFWTAASEQRYTAAFLASMCRRGQQPPPPPTPLPPRPQPQTRALEI